MEDNHLCCKNKVREYFNDMLAISNAVDVQTNVWININRFNTQTRFRADAHSTSRTSSTIKWVTFAKVGSLRKRCSKTPVVQNSSWQEVAQHLESPRTMYPILDPAEPSCTCADASPSSSWTRVATPTAASRRGWHTTT